MGRPDDAGTAGRAEIERSIRDAVPQVLAALVRRNGDFSTCEDAVQDASLAAAVQWPNDGIPQNPVGWLLRVAQRRVIETWRSESARRRREETSARLEAPGNQPLPAEDDTLVLFMLCCHPSLTKASQVALTLRAVGGLTTSEIARAFLVPDATIGQRISRAKERIRQTGGDFRMPPPDQLKARLAAVLQVLYLIFTEGHTATSDPQLVRVDLCDEALRLARQLHDRIPGNGEVAGLLALMLLTDARRHARVGPGGNLIPLRHQDRTRWEADKIAEGTAIITESLTTKQVGPLQLQAAIAALHDEAGSADETDWPQILRLYDLLQALSPGPMVALNRTVAVAMVHGADRGLAELDEVVAANAPLADHHRTHAVRAHLLEMTGNNVAARTEYRRAAQRTLSIPERRYLETQTARLDVGGDLLVDGAFVSDADPQDHRTGAGELDEQVGRRKPGPV
jgi:predicted RNA polymerase sigma factor